MKSGMRYRLRAQDGRFVSYALGPFSVSLDSHETAYVFRHRVDADTAAEIFGNQLGERLLVVPYPPLGGEMRVGDRVKFSAPQTPNEEKECFELLELRGDRALVRFSDSGMRINPTFVYRLEDLVAA